MLASPTTTHLLCPAPGMGRPSQTSRGQGGQLGQTMDSSSPEISAKGNERRFLIERRYGQGPGSCVIRRRVMALALISGLAGWGKKDFRHLVPHSSLSRTERS